MPERAFEMGIGHYGPTHPDAAQACCPLAHTYAPEAPVGEPAAMLTGTPIWGTIDQVIEQMFDLLRAVAMMGWRAPE